jgi:hypothetical protein
MTMGPAAEPTGLEPLAGNAQKTRPKAGFEVESREAMKEESPSIADVLLATPSGQFNFENPSTLLHNPLLLSKPGVKGHPLGEVGVLKFPLGPCLFGAGDAGCDLEETHGMNPRKPDG